MIYRRCWHICRVLSSSFLLLVVLSAVLHAQTPPPLAPPAPPPEQQTQSQLIAPPCADCYKGFKFDSTFRIGAHFNGAWSGAATVAKNTLNIEVTQLYNQRSSLRGFLDSTRWQAVTASHDNDYNNWLWQARGRWADSLSRQFWRDIRAADLKVIVGPGWIPVISKSTELSEAFFGQAGKDTYTKGGWDNPNNDTLHRIDFLDFGVADSMDRERNKLVWGGKFNKAVTDTTPVLMAGGHQYTQMALGDIDTSVYGLVGHKSDSGKYDISLAIKINEDPQVFNDLPLSTLFGFVKVYRRIPVGQDSCGCQLYQVVDSLAITKRTFLDTLVSDTTAGNGYRDINFALTFPESTFLANTTLTVERKPGQSFTALVGGTTYPKYTPRSGFKYWFDKRMAHGNENDTAGYGRYCKRLRDSLVNRGYYSASKVIDRADLIPYGDLSYDVYTTKKVDVSLLRGRIAPYTFRLVHKGVYNAAILADVDSVRADTTYQHELFRFGVVDEHTLSKYRGYMEVASNVQRNILKRDPNDKRGLWANPMADASSFRVLTGDLDTTEIRMVHMAANQIYNFGGRVPISYANPDSMIYRSGADSGKRSSALFTGLYRATPRVPSPGFWTDDRIIAFNSPSDYNAYTDVTIQSIATRRDQLVAMVNASRFMFRHIRRESYPVYSVVQVHGYLGKLQDANGNDTAYSQTWDRFRPITPEEISVQSWMVLNTGCDGLWFSDFCFDDAGEFGVVHWLTGDHSSNYQNGLYSGDPYKVKPANWTMPLIWTGFNDRFNAVKKVTDELRTNILPVYQKLDHNGIRMAVYRDTNFAAMPMLDTIYTQQAARNKNAQGKYQPLTETVGGKPVPVYDSLRATYLEATVFNPGPQDTARYARYLLLTNLRCWPVDYHTYSTFPDSLYKLNIATDSNRYQGFGAIDVRRPVVILKNTTNVIADSAIVQRIGDTTKRAVAFGVPVSLDWIEPGWGAMYRITPIAKPVSPLGTAYNNAVHSLNPSVDGADHDRIFVYERDSVVFLRTMDARGAWGAEYRISDSSDMQTVSVNGKSRNTADNLFPSIDMMRSSGSSCAIVWERHDTQTDSVTVEMAWLPSKPTRNYFPRSDSIRRVHVTVPRKFAQTWMQLTPSIVGVDDGYLVAWAAPNYTTEIKAVRDNPILSTIQRDTSRTLRVKLKPKPPLVMDSATAYPTLAYTRNWQEVALNGGMISGPDSVTAFTTVTAHIDGIPDTMGSYHIAHLAYQQGARSGNNTFFIEYNQIGSRFPDRNTAIPEIWSSPTEEVTYDVAACTRLYPSIAVDSVHVGVTFTIHAPPVDPIPTSYVCLRFRNMGANVPIKQRWTTTPLYSWGGKQAGQQKRMYERSSMTMFPTRDITSMAGAFEGGMTWQWINAPTPREHGVKFYHFGDVKTDSVPDGAHPTMTLVPCVGDNAIHAMKSTSIFRRGSAASQMQRPNIRNQARFYEPAYCDNAPSTPIEAFGIPTPADTIHAEGTLRKSGPFTDCSIPPSATVTTTMILTPKPKPPFPPQDTLGPPVSPPWNEWGMPPTFFPKGPTWEKPVISVADLGNIQRTPTFPADSSYPKITRIMAGSDSLIYWLNSQPNDSLYGIPANIFYMMQIVRESDSVVLWMGDTISARGIGSDTIEQDVTIPIGSVTTPGTNIFVRLATRPTNGLSYELIGGFHFIDDGASGTSSAKRVVKSAETSSMAGETIGVKMIPNPLHTTTGELHITVPTSGSATVSVVDLLGNRVMTLQPIEIKRAGEYAVPVDLSGLRDGVYIVDVRTNSGHGSTRITLIR